MLVGPKPRVLTFLSALPEAEKSAMLVNLGTSLARTGSDVLLVDACAQAGGVSSRIGMPHGATLLDVARQQRALNQTVQTMQQGLGLATVAREVLRSAAQDPDQARRLKNAFDILAAQADIVVVDGELDKDGSFPISTMTMGEIVVQVSNSAESIKSAYSIIKRLNAQLGRRPFGVLVTGVSEREAQVVYENMAQAASRYLAVQLNSMGSVPADEHLKRATYLGRSVVEAFPLAGASVAFRRLAGRFASSEARESRPRAAGAHFGI